MAGLRYRALLIGNATFPRDPHGLPALDGPLADIEALRQALTDDEVGLFDPGDVEALPDHGVQELRERLDEFYSTAAREDVLLLYYSGHGEQDVNGTLYLCTHDTSTSVPRSTALSAPEINNMVTSSAAATTIIVLDCCHSGAFKGGQPAIPAAGTGRYVLTSNRATQFARAAARPGQPSPFTGLLVHGLRHADAKGHLTITELYKQVHGWMTKGTALAPQLRIAGEGEVVIARRGDPALPQPPPAEPSIETAGDWRAQRVRTGGVGYALRVGDGTAEHIVEYRAHQRHPAEVLVDGKRVHRGPQYLDCEFGLDPRGTRARLKVSQEPDIQLWVEGRLVYTLRSADPDSFLEHQAHTIRMALLTAKDAQGPQRPSWLDRLEVAPDIPGRTLRAVLGTASRGAPADPVIGMLTPKRGSLLRVQTVFTDRALHIRSLSGSTLVPYTVVPYSELLATSVTSDSSILDIGGRRLHIPDDADDVAKVVNRVKGALLHEETGLGEPPLAPPQILAYVPPDRRHLERALALTWVTVVLGALVTTAVYLHGYPDSDKATQILLGWIFAGGVSSSFLAEAIGEHFPTKVMRIPVPGFSWSLALIAAYATAASAWVAWAPNLFGDLSPRYGWSTRLGDVLTIAMGNDPQIVAMGAGARVSGTLLVAAAVFLPAAITLTAIHWARLRHHR